MNMWKKSVLKVQMNDKTTVDKPCWLNGHVAIQKTGYVSRNSAKWKVSHHPSGLGFAAGFRLKRDAIYFCNELISKFGDIITEDLPERWYDIDRRKIERLMMFVKKNREFSS